MSTSTTTRPPKPLNKGETTSFTKAYQSITTTPILTNASFQSPRLSTDVSNVRCIYSQRDLNTNGFKSLISHKIQTQPNQSQYTTISPSYEASTSVLTSPSGLYTLSMRVNTTPGVNGAPATKQTLLEIFTQSNELITQQYLDGYILTTTPFTPPQWSPDEKHILFTFVSNTTIKTLQTLLTERIKTGINEPKEDKKDEKSNNINAETNISELKLNVEQLFHEMFTDTRFHTHMDLGEQLNGIQYPYLLIFSINNPTTPITSVHHPSLYSTLMPTLFQFAPTINNTTIITEENIDTNNYSPYSVIFVAQPIFPHRLGTIFYTTRASRLYCSVVHLLTTDIIPTTTIYDTDINSKLTPIIFQQPKIPLLFCLTPDAHSVHAVEVYTPSESQDTQHQQQQQLQPKLQFINDYIDITYFESHAYDDRWGLSQNLRQIVNTNLINNGPNINEYTVDDYLSDNIHQPGKVHAELLTPHNTTLALRLLRFTKLQYTTLITTLSKLSQYINLSTIAGESLRTKFPIPQSISTIIDYLDQQYRNSLPEWPLQTGIRSTEYIFNQIDITTSLTTTTNITQLLQKNINNDDKNNDINQFYNLISTFPIPQSLLPVNSYSYGVYMAGNSTIYRLNSNTIAFNSCIRETDVVEIIQYKSLNNDDNNNTNQTYDVTLSILLPPTVTEDSFSKLQLNQTTTFNTPQDGPNSSQLEPLIALGDNYKPIFTVDSDHKNTSKKQKRVTKLPQLPIPTQFNNDINIDINSTSLKFHKTLPSMILLDIRGTNEFLVSIASTNTPPAIYRLTIDLKSLQVPTSLHYKSIPELYCPSLQFHTTSLSTTPIQHQIYTPYLFQPQQSIKVADTTFSPLLQQSLQQFETISVDIRPYNSYGQCQALVSYDTNLFQINSTTFQPRAGSTTISSTSATTQLSPLCSKSPKGVILLPHGGPHSHFSNLYDFVTNFFCLQGYLVIRVNYSGSPSYGEQSLRSLMGFIGYMDTTECIFTLDTVCALFNIESNNNVKSTSTTPLQTLPLHYFGGSHSGYLGGFVTIYRHFATCVIRNAVLSLHTTGSTSDIYDWVFSCLGMIPQPSYFYFSDEGNDEDNIHIQTIMNFHSPITYIQFIKSPTLLEIGGGDKRVPCLQSNVYAKVLNQNNVYSMVSYYPTAQHSLNDTPHIHAHSACSALAFFKQFESE